MLSSIIFEAVVCVAVDGIDDVAEVAEHMLTWGWVLTDCVQESAYMDLDFSRWFPVEVPLEVMQKDGKRAVMAIGRLSGPLHVGAPS